MENKIKKPSVLKFFEYRHLPEPLRAISKQYSDCANSIYSGWLKDGNKENIAELIKGFNKLLEAKDCAVRAFLK